jgi:hypothetical protein
MANPNQNRRSKSTGRYVRSLETVARDAECARLYGDEGWTYQQIATHFGWADRSTAFEAVHRGYRDAAAPARNVRKRRDAELQFLWDSAMEILESRHVVVSNGRVIELDGEPLRDDNPRLQAIEQLRKVNESWRRMDGTDEPSRVSVDAEQLGRDINRLLDNLAPDDDSDA